MKKHSENYQAGKCTILALFPCHSQPSTKGTNASPTPEFCMRAGDLNSGLCLHSRHFSHWANPLVSITLYQDSYSCPQYSKIAAPERCLVGLLVFCLFSPSRFIKYLCWLWFFYSKPWHQRCSWCPRWYREPFIQLVICPKNNSVSWAQLTLLEGICAQTQSNIFVAWVSAVPPLIFVSNLQRFH